MDPADTLMMCKPAGGGGGVTPTTWNPSDKSSIITLSGGNLVCTLAASTGLPGVRAIASSSSAKWYYETTVTATATGSILIGLATSAASLSTGTSSGAISYYGANGNVYNNVTSVASGLPLLSTFTTLRVAVDLSTQKLWFGDEGGWWNSGDPGAGTNPIYSGFASGTYYAFAAGDNNLDSWYSDFGQSPVYAVPAGFGPTG